MSQKYLDTLPHTSKAWLNSLTEAEYKQMQQWLKSRIRFFKTIPFIKTHIQNLPLSTRAYNVLRQHNILTVEEIVRCGFDQIALLKGISSKSVIEIQKAITKPCSSDRSKG